MWCRAQMLQGQSRCASAKFSPSSPRGNSPDCMNAKRAQIYWEMTVALSRSAAEPAGERHRLPWASCRRPLQSYRAEGSDNLEGWSEACGKLPASPSPKDSSGCHRRKAGRPGGTREEETLFISQSGECNKSTKYLPSLEDIQCLGYNNSGVTIRSVCVLTI